jgi:SAM-dependent methyltransferase
LLVETIFFLLVSSTMIPPITLFEHLLHRLHLLPTPVVDSFSSVLFGRALAIAVRRGVFEALAAGASSPREIALATRMNTEGVELLLEAFTVTGYVSSRSGRYTLTQEARTWLVKASPWYIGNLVQYFETLYDRWEYLEHSLEHGTPPRRYYDTFTRDDWRTYVHGMSDLARLMMKEVMRTVAFPPSSGSLLDLGGSHGLYAIECCRRNPSLKATVVDFAGALQYTAGIVGEAGLSDRIRLLEADILQAELPPNQDCVLMFNIIHGFREGENKDLARRALSVLKPGGRIYILDQFRETDRRSALARFIPLMVGLNLLNEVGGRTYSLSDMQRWYIGAARIKRFRLRLPGVSFVEIVR